MNSKINSSQQFAGFDIGGANIKFATLDEHVSEVAFEMWKYPERLAETLTEFVSHLSGQTKVGITMTAELADCFASKKEGVCFVVDAVEKSLSSFSPLFYRTDGTMVDSAIAKEEWNFVAAANWHALAWMAFKESEYDSGFLVDIGSTTTDIIPVRDGLPYTAGQTDLDRLANAQLLYAGVERTPICSLLDSVDIGGAPVGVAREFFATIADAFRWLGDVECISECLNTADGRPATKMQSASRLARMVCAETNEIGDVGVEAIALQSKRAFVELLKRSLVRVCEQHLDLPKSFLVSGGGSWLATEVLASMNSDFEVVPVKTTPVHAQCAAAAAVAMKRMEYSSRESDV